MKFKTFLTNLRTGILKSLLLLSAAFLKLFVLFLTICFLASSCATYKLGKSGQKKIANKTVVIVGASSGFGRGIAEQLGTYKANVVIAARRTDLLEEIATNIRNAGGTATVVTTDISKPEDVQHLADTVIRQFGHIDVWINMAGVGIIGKFWDVPLQDQARIVDINLKGFIYGSYAAVQQFRKQGYGTLINLGSIESENPLAYHASYAATKAGILNLSQALNQELRIDGLKKIKVVTIEPWAVDTPFFDHAVNYSGHTGRMAMMDPPRKVVNAVIRRSLRPRKEQPVGWKARSAWISHHLFPHFTERLSANIAHKQQYRKAGTLPNTSGSAYQPMQTGRGVEGGVEKRMEQENKLYRKRKKS